MDQKSFETGHYVVGYRVLPLADGQPDFTEAFSTLNEIVGDECWMPLSNQPHFEARSIGAETVYLMPIFVETSALILLKFHDIFKNEIRIFEEKLANEEDFNAALINSKPAET